MQTKRMEREKKLKKTDKKKVSRDFGKYKINTDIN